MTGGSVVLGCLRVGGGVRSRHMSCSRRAAPQREGAWGGVGAGVRLDQRTIPPVPSRLAGQTPSLRTSGPVRLAGTVPLPLAPLCSVGPGALDQQQPQLGQGRAEEAGLPVQPRVLRVLLLHRGVGQCRGGPLQNVQGRDVEPLRRGAKGTGSLWVGR